MVSEVSAKCRSVFQPLKPLPRWEDGLQKPLSVLFQKSEGNEVINPCTPLQHFTEQSGRKGKPGPLGLQTQVLIPAWSLIYCRIIGSLSGFQLPHI